ncbi:MAG: response regulator [Candidatus Dormibacteraeota bacterium]|nr:response regulator [Candidatus Dormibacteraeota bacterium]MBV8446011.1 response regulator [Candidatus Dormibacteraeota bacterium]
MAEGGARILVAEDQASVAEPILDRFSILGYTTRWARAVREARRELHEFSPDLLVLDTTLDTDGLELFQALRFAPEHPPGGVVVLVEPGDVPTRERAQQLGAAAVLMKPIRGDELVDVVEDLLTFI